MCLAALHIWDFLLALLMVLVQETSKRLNALDLRIAGLQGRGLRVYTAGGGIGRGQDKDVGWQQSCSVPPCQLDTRMLDSVCIRLPMTGASGESKRDIGKLRDEASFCWNLLCAPGG